MFVDSTVICSKQVEESVMKIRENLCVNENEIGVIVKVDEYK